MRARSEVIVSAGALNTPRLLQISGIGPGEHLQSIGVDVVVNLPGEARSIGQILRVHIERAGPHSVWGQVAEES